MVSRPTFDPNKFTVRIRSKDWREYADDPDRPLFNRVIQAQLAPGIHLQADHGGGRNR